MRAVRVSWAVALFTCACLAAYAGLEAGHLVSMDSIADGFPVIPLGVLAGAVLGALIIARHPRHRIGWLLAVASAGGAIGFAASAYAYRVFASPGGGPVAAGHWAAWVAQFFGAAYALGFTCALFLLVPDGRMLSRRWWPVMGLLVASYLLWAGVLLVGVAPHQVRPEGIAAGPVAEGLLNVSSLLLLVAIVAAAVGLVVRLRRAGGVQRRQLRWIAASGGLLATGVLTLVGYQVVTGGPEPWYVDVPLFLGYTSLPVFAGIAVLRYRLYDIDVIISRAVVLAVLFTFVTLGYVAVVVTIGALLGGRVADSFWPSLVALVLVALAFQPLRQRVLRLADRLVYGQLATPYEALTRFSRQVGRAPAELLPALAEAVGHGVGATHARVALETSGAPGPSVTWARTRAHTGPAGAPDTELAVRDRGETLGRVAVWLPPGRGLRPAERRLLADFAAHAGLALRTLRLDADLRARVDELARQATELAASRRRLLAVRDAERERIAGVIEREVISHLRPIPDAVDALDVSDPAADETLRTLEEATAAGLDALRDVTRGLRRQRPDAAAQTATSRSVPKEDLAT
jgi:hypothetical protein